MGKALKIIFSSAIVILVLIYAVLGYTLNRTMDAKIAKLDEIATNATRKKESLIELGISLQSVRKNLETQLSLEKEKARQKELAAQLTALNEEQQKRYLQQLEAQRQQDLENQKIAAAAAAASVKKSSGSSSRTTTTTAPTTAPKPPKVTRAS
jgi:hypothetical protein